MEQRAKLKVNMSTYRRVNIEHKINENMLKRNYLSKIEFYQSRERRFHQKYEQYLNHLEENSSLNQQISHEHENQLKTIEQKEILLKKFDELKHTINDPYSALSVLAALSRSLLE